MKPASQQLGVPQLEGDYLESLLLQEPDQGALISIHDYRIRIDAEDVHVDPVTANQPGRIVAMTAYVLHRRAVNDFPLLEHRGQRVIADASSPW